MLGIGAIAMLVAILILQSALGLGVSPNRTLTNTTTTTVVSTTTTTVTSMSTTAATSSANSTATNTSAAYKQVASAFASHTALLNSRNISGLEAEYWIDSSINWTGVYSPESDFGPYQIESNLQAFFGQFDNFTISNETYTISPSNESSTFAPEGSYWVVNSSFVFAGYGDGAGKINGSILAQDTYVSIDGAWTISGETWDWLSFHTQYPTMVLQPISLSRPILPEGHLW
jgi:hypothetical protein